MNVGPMSGSQALFVKNPNTQDADMIMIPTNTKDEFCRASRIHDRAGIAANIQKTPAPIPVAAQASTQKIAKGEETASPSVTKIVSQKKTANAATWARPIRQGLWEKSRKIGSSSSLPRERAQPRIVTISKEVAKMEGNPLK